MSECSTRELSDLFARVTARGRYLKVRIDHGDPTREDESVCSGQVVDSGKGVVDDFYIGQRVFFESQFARVARFPYDEGFVFVAEADLMAVVEKS